MTGVESPEQYINRADSSRISKVEPRRLLRPYNILEVFLFYGGDLMKLFVGCSSKDNIDKKYLDDCEILIKKLAKFDNIELVYGNDTRGIMGIAYREFSSNNKKVTAVSTDYHHKIEINKAYDEIVVTDSTTGRFEEIHKISDVLLFLPGGLGTLAELFSAIEEHRIEKGKKIILYNCDYFYTPIIEELYKLHQEGFIDEVPADYMMIESDSNKIIEMIKEEMN